MRNVIIAIAVLAHVGTAHADAGDRWDGIMILEQSGAALGLGAAGGGIGLAIGYGIGTTSARSKSDWGPPLAGAVIGGSLGMLAGITLGVKLVGDARGGNGGWGATIAGSVGGGLLTLFTASRITKTRSAPYIAMGLSAVTLIAPPILAYHLSTDDSAEDHAKRVMVPLILSTF